MNTVAKYDLWERKESFVVAISGGPDSLCLLDVLYLLSQRYDFTLHIAHVNYRLRGKDSDLDEALVRERATHYQIPLSVLHPKKTTSSNLEEKLRDIRYRFFEKIRTQKKATLIAVAHHRDDQAETFLLRLLRGSGMKGLSAIQPKNNYIVRPLIDMSREDILRYLKERNIRHRTDQSNSDPKFLRNKIRHSLIPLLEREYQTNIKKILADTATLLAADYALFDHMTPLPYQEKNGALVFSTKTLLSIPETLLRHQFRTLLITHYQKKSPPQRLIDEIIKVFRSTKNKHHTLTFGGLKIERKGDTVRLFNF